MAPWGVSPGVAAEVNRGLRADRGSPGPPGATRFEDYWAAGAALVGWLAGLVGVPSFRCFVG